MMNSSDIGLIPVQHKSDLHDLAFAASKSSIDIKPRDVPSLLSISPTPSTMTTPSPTTSINGDKQQHQRPTEVKFMAAAAAQIKRKRGRPRKYTFGPFPSQGTNSSHTRLSLSSTFPKVEHNDLSLNDSNGMGGLEQPKKPRLGRPSKSYLPASNGTNTSAGMKNVKAKEQTEQQPQSHDLVSSKFHSATVSTALFHKVIYPPQSPALLNGHTNGTSTMSNGGTNTSSHMTLSSGPTFLATAPLKPSAPVFMEYYNGAISSPTAALMPPPLSMSATHLATAACSSIETGLIRRLLPQAEAAVNATRAGGYPGPHAWTSEMVGSFIATLPGCQNLAHAFIDNEVDGAALLCLEQHDLMMILKLKLGPAVKIFGAIRTLRQALLSIPYNDLTADHSSMLATVVSCFPPLTTASATQTSATAMGNSAPFSINNLTVEETSVSNSSASSSVGVVVMNGTVGRGSPSLVVGPSESFSH